MRETTGKKTQTRALTGGLLDERQQGEGEHSLLHHLRERGERGAASVGVSVQWACGTTHTGTCDQRLRPAIWPQVRRAEPLPTRRAHAPTAVGGIVTEGGQLSG